MKLFIFLFTLLAAIYVTTIYPALVSADEGTRQQLRELSKQVKHDDAVAATKREHARRVARVSRVLADAGSPMAEAAESFITCGERYGTDWKLLLGIAEHESGFGKQGYAVHSNNAFGWGVHDGITFNSWGDGVCAVAKGLAGPRYKGKSIEEIIHIYAPASDGNDPKSYAFKLRKSIKAHGGKV